MYLDKVFIKHPSICVVPKKELVCVFPLLGRNSLEIKKRLQNTIVDHFHFKDVIPKKLCPDIVYNFKCNSCNAIYYGKTKRHYYVRAAEHMGISHLTKKGLKMSSNQLFQIMC